MNAQIALIIYGLFIIYLFWKDAKKSDFSSNALWIPIAWMFLAGSRYVGEWLNLAPPKLVASYIEGSPIDAAAFFVLISAGLIILIKRKIAWKLVLTENKFVWFYFLFCAFSITWADYPIVSVKRLIKELGNVVMILIILTEKHAYEAMGVILKRLSFLWLPLSVLFIKYFPELGRTYHTHSGIPMYTGISVQKNQLGAICLISGIYFSWKYLLKRKDHFKFTWKENHTDIILIVMICWLLHMSQSQTSFVCLLIASTLFYVSSFAVVVKKPSRIVSIITMIFIFGIFLEVSFGLKDTVIDILGRNSSLTERVPMWDTLIEMADDPIFGAGFQSFWMGERLERIWSVLGVNFTQAHNGYLEQYLNLGYLGVTLIGFLIISGLVKIIKQLRMDYSAALLRLCFLIIAVFYNYTEASFYGVNNIWLLTLFAIMDMRYIEKLTVDKQQI